jgi:hypothetical protein
MPLHFLNASRLIDRVPLAAMTLTREDKVRAFVRETINTVLTNSRPN